MTRIQTFDTFQEFLTHNQDKILGEYFPYYLFLQALKRLNQEKISLFDSFNILGKGGESIFCIWTEGTYYIFGDEWNSEMIATAAEKINPSKFKNYTFLGRRQLIDSIFEAAKCPIDSRRDRIVYSCKNILDIPETIGGIVELGSSYYKDQLIENGILYYHEEFEGKGSKSDEQIAEDVAHSIEKGNIYSLRIEDKIHSIVSVINYEYNRPFIGSLYTREESRNKGYALKLLYEVTNGLLKNGSEECGLLSNADNPASNKVFNKLGYNPIYDLVLAFKEKRE